MLIPSESPIHCKELPTHLGFVGEFLPETWPAECALVPGHCAYDMPATQSKPGMKLRHGARQRQHLGEYADACKNLIWV